MGIAGGYMHVFCEQCAWKLFVKYVLCQDCDVV